MKDREIDFLFINSPNAFAQYIGSKLNSAVLTYPLLSFASLAAVLREKGARVAILDLGIVGNDNGIEQVLKELKPKYVGFTATTPLFPKIAELGSKIRRILEDRVTLLLGGPHATALPEESLKSSEFDILVFGEGEETVVDIWEGKELGDINGIYYKENGKIIKTARRKPIADLDQLPFVAVDLFDSENYHGAKALSKAMPNFQYESSRGCNGVCTFCNKNIFGYKFRPKSPERVVEEIEFILSNGYKEIRFVDDQFNSDIDRGIKICELIIRKGLKFPWSLASGMRVDTVNEEFFRIARRAGCYQIGVGFESGTQTGLDSISKNITIEQSRKCMAMMKNEGIEVLGFFILGLPNDTEESMEETIKFAVKLKPDFAKATILMPFPGTRLFNQYERKGLIKTRNWEKYNFHQIRDVYRHPILDFATLDHYYEKFFWRFYLHPYYIGRKLLSSYKSKTIKDNFISGLQTFFPSRFVPSIFKYRDAYEYYEDVIAKRL